MERQEDQALLAATLRLALELAARGAGVSEAALHLLEQRLASVAVSFHSLHHLEREFFKISSKQLHPIGRFHGDDQPTPIRFVLGFFLIVGTVFENYITPS